MLLGASARADDLPLGVSSDEPAPPTVTLVEPTVVDLRVQHVPVQMKMRPKVAQTDSTTATTEPAEGVQKFTPIPRSMRDLAERVTFNIRAGVAIDSGPASGETLRGGAQLPDGYTDSRSWILGDAMVAARDLLLPSLGAYFLSSFQLDASDSLATRAWSVNYSDATGQQLAIKAGYAEWGRDDRRPDQHAWVRAGRQFRLDGGSLFAYFDGATAGYRTVGWNASAFAGRRVALYVDTPAGVVFGTTAAVDLKSLSNVPARASLDYMGLAIDAFDVSQIRQLAALNASYDVSKAATASARARIVDSGDGSGLGLGRIGARIRVQPSRNLIVIGDVEHRTDGDLAYDLAAPSAVDITQIANQLGVGLAVPIDATTIGARVDYRKQDTELLVFGRAELPSDPAAATTADQRGWVELGAALAGSPIGIRGKGVWVTGQYTLRQYRDPDKSDAMGSELGDASTSGLDRLHELAGEATLASGGTGQRWRFAAGVFYRVYDFATPYVTIANEGRAGGRADLSVWFTKAVRGQLAAEVAESSPVLARELGTLSSVRAAMEARW